MSVRAIFEHSVDLIIFMPPNGVPPCRLPGAAPPATVWEGAPLQQAPAEGPL